MKYESNPLTMNGFAIGLQPVYIDDVTDLDLGKGMILNYDRECMDNKRVEQQKVVL